MRQILTDFEGYLEVVVAFSWCCTGAARGVWVAEYVVKG
jgi:hypothetical protein